MSESIKVSFHVNAEKIQDKVSPTLMLADYLHEVKNMTATRVCCGIGVCRACTVAVKRPGQDVFEATRSCITPVASLEGATVRTTEGLSEGDELHPLQANFLKHFSFQCGYSTSGFLMGAYALLDRLRKEPIEKGRVDEVILEAVGDNICRCTGYQRYFSAIKETILATKGLVK